MAAFNKANLRKSPRLTVTPKSEIVHEGKAYKAIVQDLSDSGMLLLSSRDFDPGTRLEVRLHLSASVDVECIVVVRHCTDMGIGAQIERMDERNDKAYHGYLQEYFSHQLNKSG